MIDISKVYEDTRGALISEFINSGAFTQEQIAFENVKFDTTAKQPYCELGIENINNDQVTLGVIGRNEHSGYLSASLVWPKGSGTVDITKKADEIRFYFEQLKRINYNDLIIDITSVVKAGGYPDGEWYRVPVTVNYKTQVPRGL